MGTERIDATGSGSTAGPGTGAVAVPGARTVAAASPGGFSFHALMEDLNPLQYIPVVGAIYRAVTGDEGNETLRFAASLGTSFALGGPLGLGITVAEKVLGIDPEKLGRQLLGHLLHPHAAVSVSEAGGTAGDRTTGTAASAASAATAPRGWTAQELAAYGIRRTAEGSLSGPAGATTGADLLNTLELNRLAGHAA